MIMSFVEANVSLLAVDAVKFTKGDIVSTVKNIRVELTFPAELFAAIVMLFVPGAASMVALLHPGSVIVSPVVFTSQHAVPFDV